MRRATALHIDERPVSRAEYEAPVARVEAIEAQRGLRDAWSVRCCRRLRRPSAGVGHE
jgi:hypothetical protein